MKAVEVAVRNVSRFSPRDIDSVLMNKAFDFKTGPLTDMTVEECERDAACICSLEQLTPTKIPILIATPSWKIPMKRPKSYYWPIIFFVLLIVDENNFLIFTAKIPFS